MILKQSYRVLFVLSIFLFFYSVLSHADFSAKVIKVTDGDTIKVIFNNKKIVIRLQGIDCPEMSQPFGPQAKDFTMKKVFNKVVRIESDSKDRYGRLIGIVYLNDVCLNKELLKAGLAWHYKKYSSDKEMATLESNAREKKLGLWSQMDPIAPWDYRSNR